jgi:hypothetical protein
MGPGPNYIKLSSSSVIYKCKYTTMYVSGKPFQHCLMFAGKAKSLPTNIVSGRDQHSNFLLTFVNYGRKKFHNIWARTERSRKI